MNIYKDIQKDIHTLVHRLFPDIPQASLTRVNVEPPRDAAHGDMATNAAMVLARDAGMKPGDLAEKLAAELKQLPAVTGVEIAGPGFINLTLTPDSFRAVVPHALKTGAAHFGDSDLGAGQKVNVEYVSANPTGPIHFGHTRNAVFGDALARLLEKSGHKVTREYYTNDAGAQVDTLARSVYLRYREALGEKIEIPQGFYPGDYLVPVAREIAREKGREWLDAPESVWLEEIKRRAVAAMMELIEKDLKLIDVRFDVFTSERALTEAGSVDRAVKKLEDMGLVYTGVLPPPKSKKVKVEDWEPTELLLFRASQFGDDQDRPLKKSDGTWAYTTPDIAYQYDKFLRGFEKLIVVVAVDHAGWVSRIKAGAAAVSGGKAVVSVQLYGLVNLMKNGQPVKLSKRAGNILTLREIVDEVGPGPVRFIMLTRKSNETIDFDMALAIEQSKDNPFFYVQYAHARCCSVMKHAADMFGALDDAALGAVDLSLLDRAEEMTLIRLIATWPRVVEQAAVAEEPHRIAYYLYDLAAAFHAWWNRGRDDATLRFLLENDKPRSLARLALLRAVALTIASALGVIGVEPLSELRSDVEVEAA
ncbi:MAG: arginine--tRNA ligase [Rhodospirillales bacterium]|nr:arginine--tRNA ligase [Alphaproteobacteria bacterium]MCB9987597.1 arginine--tRNA ligase [Rhodospirillales bacterium]USO07688.1 MAG: arginine--tRNA ligase [Rhodospirillales bacterium]